MRSSGRSARAPSGRIAAALPRSAMNSRRLTVLSRSLTNHMLRELSTYQLYSFHAPEVECIGKGKASALMSSAFKPQSSPPTPAHRAASSALPGNPYDGHTLGHVIEATEKLTGCGIERAYVDKGYRGHKATNPRRVFISGQKRGVFRVIKRELRRRSAIEPVVGHLKTDGHLGRCHLKGREGDAANVVLTAIGHNLRLVLTWLRLLLRLILLAPRQALSLAPAFRWAS